MEPSLQLLLEGDHLGIEALLGELDEALRDGVPKGTIGPLWTRLATRLRAHLDLEEAELFPALTPRHAAEVAGLRREHDAIRAVLAQVDVEVDLHLVRRARVREIARMLRDHQVRETRGVYLRLGALSDDAETRIRAGLEPPELAVTR